MLAITQAMWPTMQRHPWKSLQENERLQTPCSSPGSNPQPVEWRQQENVYTPTKSNFAALSWLLLTGDNPIIWWHHEPRRATDKYKYFDKHKYKYFNKMKARKPKEQGLSNPGGWGGSGEPRGQLPWVGLCPRPQVTGLLYLRGLRSRTESDPRHLLFILILQQLHAWRGLLKPAFVPGTN